MLACLHDGLKAANDVILQSMDLVIIHDKQNLFCFDLIKRSRVNQLTGIHLKLNIAIM